MFPAEFCNDLLMRSHKFSIPYQRKVSVMIWGCITWYGVGTLCKVDGNINAVKYRDILDNHLWPFEYVHTVILSNIYLRFIT
jgi:hypothetical protein